MIHVPTPTHRTGFARVERRTKTRRLLLLLLRPEGLSWVDAIKLGFVRDRLAYRTTIARLEYEYGFDIRKTGQVLADDEHGDVYRIVGKHRWNGSYRAIYQVPDSLPNFRN